MKKLYFFLMAMMVAVVANAADYYLIGGFNNWAESDAKCKFTAQGDGTYVLDYAGTLTSGFKLNDGSWANDAANFGGSSVLTVGETYNLQVGGSSGNIQLTENIENPHIVFNPTAATLLITGATSEAKVAYDIWGSLTSSAWASTALTEKNGKWVAENVTVSYAGANFGIRVLDATTGVQTDWLSAAGASAINAAGVYDLQVEGTNFSIAAGTWSFTLDPEAMTLTVAGEGGVVVPPTPGTYAYALHGSWASSDWQTIALTEADGKWTATVDVTNPDANFGIQQLENGEQTGWLWSADSATINAAGTYAVVLEGGAGKNFAIATGKWTLTFDPEANTLTVTGESEEVDYTTWYLNVLGDFNEWKDNGVAFNADGVAELTDLAIGDSIFKLKIWNGADMWISNGEALTVGETYIVKGDTTANMTLVNGADYASVSVSYNAVTGELKVSGTTAVAEVEVAEGEAAYYTLQGVKVANPENGIYVKVVNGKASKVVVK